MNFRSNTSGRPLSKAQILTGIHCTKRLYLEVHKPEAAGAKEGTTARTMFGKSVGEAARRIYPDGILVGHFDDFGAALSETERILSTGAGTVLFEPAFTCGIANIRADILVKTRNAYKLIEVKSAVSVKEFFIIDSAIQAWVIERNGLRIERIEVAHINNGFIYSGDGSYEGLFTFRDVTARVRAAMDRAPALLRHLHNSLEGSMPRRETGSYCKTPHECQFLSFCTTEVIEYPLSIFVQGGTLAKDLANMGYRDAREVPESLLSNELHKTILRATVTGKPEVHPYLPGRLAKLEFPRFFLDFETVQFPIPQWKGTRSFEQLLFQWSCHRLDPDLTLTHADHIDIGKEPPMEKAALALIEILGTEGPVLVYSPFEKSVINWLIKFYPHLAPKLKEVLKRIIDLLPLFRKYYYHPAMKGSWSIKAVLPAIAPELSYAALEEVQDGLGVQNAYQEAADPATSTERRNEIVGRLREYCRLDTLALVRIVEHFRER